MLIASGLNSTKHKPEEINNWFLSGPALACLLSSFSRFLQQIVGIAEVKTGRTVHREGHKGGERGPPCTTDASHLRGAVADPAFHFYQAGGFPSSLLTQWAKMGLEEVRWQSSLRRC